MLLAGNPFSGFGVVSKAALQTNITAQAIAPPAPTVGQCSADGAFIWALASDGVTGYWRRLSVGEACTGVSIIPGPKTDTNPPGGVSVTPTDHGPIVVWYNFPFDNAASSDPNAAHQTLKVGPFTIPLGAQQFTIHWAGPLPADWQAFVGDALGHDCSNCIFTSMIDATPGHVGGRLLDFIPGLPSKINKDLVSFADVSSATTNTGQNLLEISLPDQPVAVVSRPDNGENWGMFMVVQPTDPTYPWDSTTNPYELAFYWRKQPQGVWDWIKRIVGDIVDLAEDIVNAVKSIACDLLPVASKTPNPYVMAGAVILQASGLCTPNCPTGMTYNTALSACACPLGMTYDPTSKTCVTMPAITPWYLSWYAIAGAAAIVGFALLYNPKKSKAATKAAEAAP
jgi:hypothetical protein